MVKVSVGIAGAGQVARFRHITAYRRDKRADIVAVFDPGKNPAKLESDLDIPKGYTKLQEFLEHPFEVLSICTPPMYHASLTEAALLAGKHVFVEKPMTMTAEEGRSLEKLAQEKQLLLCPSHNFLFGRAMKQAKSLIKTGKLGQVLGATAIQWSSWNRRLPSWHPDLPGGLFFDEGPHLLYLIRYFLGELEVMQVYNVEETTEIGNKKRRNSRFDISLKGERGQASINMWFGAPQSEWFLAVGFTRGTVIIDLYRNVLLYFPHELKRSYKYIVEVPTRGTLSLWKTMIRWVGHRLFRGRYLHGHEELIRLFLDAVVEGKDLPVTAYDGWQVVNLLEKVNQRIQEAQVA